MYIYADKWGNFRIIQQNGKWIYGLRNKLGRQHVPDKSVSAASNKKNKKLLIESQISQLMTIYIFCLVVQLCLHDIIGLMALSEICL